MTIKKTSTGKISMKLPYTDYCTFCQLVAGLVSLKAPEVGLQSRMDVNDRLHFLTIMRLHKRLIKSHHYPFPVENWKETVTVTLELSEALVFWFLMTDSNLQDANPALHIMSQKLHKILL